LKDLTKIKEKEENGRGEGFNFFHGVNVLLVLG
jgi:hypothetical protein